jgi:hypothetical protein
LTQLLTDAQNMRILKMKTIANWMPFICWATTLSGSNDLKQVGLMAVGRPGRARLRDVPLTRRILWGGTKAFKS